MQRSFVREFSVIKHSASRLPRWPGWYGVTLETGSISAEVFGSYRFCVLFHLQTNPKSMSLDAHSCTSTFQVQKLKITLVVGNLKVAPANRTLFEFWEH